jgi:hypothetical protein
VEVSRDYIVHILRRAGLHEVAAEAENELPDKLERERALNWAAKHGVTHDAVMSELGGSP